MARGAGKLQIGYDASKDAVADGAELVVLASDASERTKRSVMNFCGEAGTECRELDITQEEFSGKFGWKFGVAAVTDRNFAKLVRMKIEAKQEDRK